MKIILLVLICLISLTLFCKAGLQETISSFIKYKHYEPERDPDSGRIIDDSKPKIVKPKKSFLLLFIISIVMNIIIFVIFIKNSFLVFH